MRLKAKVIESLKKKLSLSDQKIATLEEYLMTGKGEIPISLQPIHRHELFK